MVENVVLTIDLSKEKGIREFLRERGFKFLSSPYAFWRAECKDCTITLYNTGKMLLQGKGVEPIVELFLEMGIIKKLHDHRSWIGSDECGKGDYFGPLVISAVFVEREQEFTLFKLGVKDSKSLSDSESIKIAEKLKSHLLTESIILTPTEYNKLSQKFKNLNKLLEHYHLQVVRKLLQLKSCKCVVYDKFSMGEINFGDLDVISIHGAEVDVGVASASVIARSEFLRWFVGAEKEYGLKFPKGASDEVISVAREFKNKYGEEMLSRVAKLHFKITRNLKSEET